MPHILDLFGGGAQEHMADISRVVMTRCPEVVEPGWSELVCEFADDHSFLSVSLSTRPGDREPTCLLEFGAQSDGERRRRGWLAGVWSRGNNCLEGFDDVVMDGRSGDLRTFVKGLDLHTALPMVGFEEAF